MKSLIEAAVSFVLASIAVFFVGWLFSEALPIDNQTLEKALIYISLGLLALALGTLFFHSVRLGVRSIYYPDTEKVSSFWGKPAFMIAGSAVSAVCIKELFDAAPFSVQPEPIIFFCVVAFVSAAIRAFFKFLRERGSCSESQQLPTMNQP